MSRSNSQSFGLRENSDRGKSCSMEFGSEPFDRPAINICYDAEVPNWFGIHRDSRFRSFTSTDRGSLSDAEDACSLILSCFFFRSLHDK